MVRTEEILRYEQNPEKSGKFGKEDYYISLEKQTIKSVKKYG